MNHSIVLIDAGTGNLHSVQRALEWCGANVLRTTSAEEVAHARKIVLPGVGAFGDFMQGLRENGIDEGIFQALEKGALLLGICVGMQALFHSGEEMGVHLGLNLLPGKVIHFPPQKDIKIPHTGWNKLNIQSDSPLFRQISSPTYVYFNHSYYCQAEDQKEIIATCTHAIEFAAAVQRERIFGVQFHPEKSQKIGLQILGNFLEITDE
ncbi:MAG: imidazole glycerol phosphate synthase subunit HisH [Anaerolineales bacterium]